jgi:tetratricopeptide (TPR) repeat protein
VKASHRSLLQMGRRLLPRGVWARVLLIGLPILVLLAFVSPVLSAIRALFDLIGALLGPALRDPTGRLVLVCASLGLGIFVAVHVLRDRIRSFRAGLILRRHLDGVAAWLDGQPERAREHWQRLLVNAEPLPREYRWVREDAAIKLARRALAGGDVGGARVFLLQLRNEDLPPALARAAAQLRALVCAADDESLPQTRRREYGAALAAFPDDPVLLGLMREQLVGDGDLRGAAALREKLLQVAPPTGRAEVREALAQDWLDIATAAQAAGEFASAQEAFERAAAVEPRRAAGSLLPGELRLAQSDLPGALRAWARVPGSTGLARAAAALDAASARLSAREILECMPNAGGLLLAARSYSRAGEHRRALRAARRAARSLGPSPTVAAVLAELLHAAGDPGADGFTAEAVARLVESATSGDVAE